MFKLFNNNDLKDNTGKDNDNNCYSYTISVNEYEKK